MFDCMCVCMWRITYFDLIHFPTTFLQNHKSESTNLSSPKVNDLFFLLTLIISPTNQLSSKLLWISFYTSRIFYASTCGEEDINVLSTRFYLPVYQLVRKVVPRRATDFWEVIQAQYAYIWNMIHGNNFMSATVNLIRSPN